MKNRLHHKNIRCLAKFTPLLAGLIISPSLGFSQDSDEEKEDVFELSPFVVDASDDMGYYASQSLAGGRLSTDIINTGSSIEVVTQDFMDDIGAADIQELLQYTNNTEVGGILGNFVGIDTDPSQGNVNAQSSVRDPDANSRIRGLSRPDSTRDFFKTNIPFDNYNTERLDINRGSNSFLFGLGSPSGLINSQLSKADFNDRTEVRFRLGSGGNRPSYRGEFDINRSIIKDRLAIRINGLLRRDQYRQEPTYRDDDRIYATLTFHPFDHKNTTIRSHYESGAIVGNQPYTLLVGHALDSWIEHRVPIDVYENIRFYRQQFGPSSGDVNRGRFTDEELIPVSQSWGPVRPDGEGGWDYIGRDAESIMGNAGASGYVIVFDGSTGADPSFIMQPQMRGAADTFFRGRGRWRRVKGVWTWQTQQAGDPFWSPDGRTNGSPQMRFYQNNRSAADRGVGWFKQGFTDLETFDFSKNNLAGGNDEWSNDFYNYNFAVEQILLDGKAGIEIAYDFQHYKRDAWTFFTAGGAEIKIDINRSLPLPMMGDDGLPLTDDNGNIIAQNMPNPNFGRPFVATKRGATHNMTDRQVIRATAFYKLDFEEYSESRPWMKWLGSHTFSLLGDRFEEDFENFGDSLRVFSEDFDIGAHMHDNSARRVTSGIRQPGIMTYLGPPVQSYLGNEVWDPNTPISMSDIILEPAPYNIRQIGDDWSMNMTYWNKGPDAENAPPELVGNRSLINGDESWQVGRLQPRWIPNEAVQLRRTEVDSWAINAQSFFLNRHLVVNTGYREDYIDSWLNRAPPKFGEDQIPSTDPDVFKWEDGEYEKIEKGPEGSGTFGYGVVLHWPAEIVKLPFKTDVSFHYNFSENFEPDTSRRTIDGSRQLVRLAAPVGSSEDFGVTFQMFDRKLIVRLNWYENVLIGRDSSVGNIFNQNLNKAFTWFNNNNKIRTSADSTDGTIYGVYDGQINPDRVEEERDIEVDDDGNIIFSETDEEVIQRVWPHWDEMVLAYNDLAEWLGAGDPSTGAPTSNYWAIKEARNRVQRFEDGGSDAENIAALTDLENAKSRGFEASITWNPTRSWRMRVNVARQQTVRWDISPSLTRFIEEDYLPWINKWGHLDWNNSAGENSGDTLKENTNENLIEYFTIKAQDGFPSDEVREWRVSMVTNYTFRRGFLNGFNVGGSMRFQKGAAIGYPLIPVELIQGGIFDVGDVNNPYLGEDLWSYDFQFGYRKRIWNDVSWTIQVNFRNLQNIDSDALTVVTTQPDGSPAKVRFDPPFQVQLTNTFRW